MTREKYFMISSQGCYLVFSSNFQRHLWKLTWQLALGLDWIQGLHHDEAYIMLGATTRELDRIIWKAQIPQICQIHNYSGQPIDMVELTLGRYLRRPRLKQQYDVKCDFLPRSNFIRSLALWWFCIGLLCNLFPNRSNLNLNRKKFSQRLFSV